MVVIGVFIVSLNNLQYIINTVETYVKGWELKLDKKTVMNYSLNNSLSYFLLINDNYQFEQFKQVSQIVAMLD